MNSQEFHGDRRFSISVTDMPLAQRPSTKEPMLVLGPHQFNAGQNPGTGNQVGVKARIVV